jgi:hypothetical protein
MLSRVNSTATRLNRPQSVSLNFFTLQTFFQPFTTPSLPMAKLDTSARLAKLRALMEQRSVHVYSKTFRETSRFGAAPMC